MVFCVTCWESESNFLFIQSEEDKFMIYKFASLVASMKIETRLFSIELQFTMKTVSLAK